MRNIILLLIMTVNAPVFAMANYGGGVSYGSYSVDDPSGPTDSSNELSLIGIMTMPINRIAPLWRYWFQMNYNAFELETRGENVAQEVTSASLEAVAQRGFNVSSDYRPWLGVGLGVGMNDYENRVTLDEDQFIDEVYPNRSNTSMFVVLNSGVSLRKSDAGFVFGTSFSHKIPLDEGIQTTQLNFFFLY